MFEGVKCTWTVSIFYYVHLEPRILINAVNSASSAMYLIMHQIAIYRFCSAFSKTRSCHF